MLASGPESREELTSGTSYSPPPAFGRFKLLHQIGAGVLGPVFRTHDAGHERLVAVKAFTLDLTPEQAAALAAELGRLAGLGIDAPCVAAPIAAGIEDLVPYIAVAYVSGESLDAAIRQYGPAPAGDAIRLVAHVADALDAAAHAGVHHGSLHPRDIIVTPGETHVTGLGVAQALERVGLHGPVRRPYVAPEREGGDEWGAAADIYALAAIAYEVLTGRRALPGTEQPLPGLSDLRVHDAAALREVIEAALDPDPGRRPSRARDFAAGFASALSETAGAAAPGQRTLDRRQRKPRTKPLKLPGLDEPLTAPPGPASVRASEAPPPAVAAPEPPPVLPPVPREPATGRPAAASPREAAPPAGDIRYVPVTDPADAGAAVPAAHEPAAGMPEARLEPDAEPVLMMDLPESSEPSEEKEKWSSGLTPVLRLADDLPPPADASGETMDAELAAALDSISPDHGAGPTPAAIGIDILASRPSKPEDATMASVEFDLAAETQLGYRGDDDRELTLPAAASPEGAGDEAGSEGFRLDLGAIERSSARVEEAVDAPLDLAPATPPQAGAVPVEPESAPARQETSAGGAEPLRPFARGRGPERRRPPSKYSRIEPPPPEPDSAGEQEAAVPRAFDQPRPTPVPRPVPDFELLTRPAASRPPVVPLLVGLAAGLVLGMAAGYWLGSRSAVPPPAQQVETARPGALAPPPAAPVAEAGPSSAGPAAVPPAVVPPSPEPERAAARPAAPVRGSIQVTADRQANVFVDGEKSGMTPRNLNGVPLGSHTIRV
ncbi:MAG: protein kinase domain-containing protein, partial [Rhodospirillaceae bacterium]